MRVIAASLISICLSVPAFAQTKILQILHTNDLHSYWETSEYEGFGGYGRLKAMMDKLQAEGEKKGWVTIRLDAGDFSDGNINFIAKDGKSSFLLARQLGYDVIALGNHDYLTGMDQLVARHMDPTQRLPLVAANIVYPRQTDIEPGRIIDRAGLKIAVAGASVKSSLWNWAAWPARFIDPERPVDKWLGEHPADLHIALTHLGYERDLKLAHESRNIDVVIGGHSHTPLFEPLWAKNRYKRHIPVVQAGAHGMYLGQLILKLTPDHAPSILRYQLHPVTSLLENDESIDQFIKEERNELARSLHVDLGQKVAHAVESYYPQIESTTLIGNFLTDAMRQATGADLAADTGFLYGDRLRAGDVTVNDLFNLAPHIYSWNYRGWTIYKCQVRPLSLAVTLSYLANEGIPLSISGFSVHLDQADMVMTMTQNGKPMDNSHSYSLAMSEGFGQALATEPFLEKFLCLNVEDSGVLMRDALVHRAQEMGVISKETLGPRRITGGTRKLIRQ